MEEVIKIICSDAGDMSVGISPSFIELPLNKKFVEGLNEEERRMFRDEFFEFCKRTDLVDCSPFRCWFGDECSECLLKLKDVQGKKCKGCPNCDESFWEDGEEGY